MLERARAKAPGLTWEQADAMALPYPDAAFDAATVGFGARNFGDLPQGLREMVRVVKPGGRVVILEITTPQKPPLSTFFSLWFDRRGAAARTLRRGLHLPAELGQAVPGPARTRG